MVFHEAKKYILRNISGVCIESEKKFGGENYGWRVLGYCFRDMEVLKVFI